MAMLNALNLLPLNPGNKYELVRFHVSMVVCSHKNVLAPAVATYYDIACVVFQVIKTELEGQQLQ